MGEFSIATGCQLLALLDGTFLIHQTTKETP